jgi:antirestriction protein ArdC
VERQSYKPRPKVAERQPVNIEWDRLMEEALTMPGSLGNTYNRFYEYSFTNQMLLYMQGVYEPVATYKRWLEMGRQVQKGSKAKAILRPIAFKQTNSDGVEESKIKGFKMVNCLFGASETEGDPLPECEPREWSRAKALGALAIREVQFTELNGNMAGYSINRDIAINPVAKYPLKTTLHEMGHIVLGHTTSDGLEEYQTHRGTHEFQAESVAYLAMNELDATDHMDAAESRGYIQGWLRGERPNDASIRQVFTSVDHILKAGR